VKFDDLKILVAKKLQCFPGLLELRYRLDTDKQKAAVTSIQTAEEFEIFKDRMRTLIIPQKLLSGKLSTRVLKPVMVSFEDGAGSDIPTSSHNSSHSGEKKVHITSITLLCFLLLTNS
jgi:hypothetical protein